VGHMILNDENESSSFPWSQRLVLE
jgi:hypothetical protein